MPMATSTPRMAKLYGKRGYRRQSELKRAYGDISLKRGRQEAEGVEFNRFPEIADRLPFVLGEIVVETTVAVFRKSQGKVPVLTGTLKESGTVRYFKSRKTGQIVTGRIDYNPKDPTSNDPKHTYGFYVEVGTHNTAAQPFLLPSLIEERSSFNQRLRDLESRL